MGKYDDYLIETLDEDCLLGAELVKRLVEQFGINEANARKILQRQVANKNIWSSTPLSFGKGELLYYNSYKKPSRKKFKELLKERRPPVFRLLDTLDRFGGILSYFEVCKITATTVEKGTTKVTGVRDILANLVSLKFVVERKDEDGNVFVLNRSIEEVQDAEDDYKALISRYNKTLTLDALFLPDIIRSLKQLNLFKDFGQYRSHQTPSKGIKFNNLYWDAINYSNISVFKDEATEPAVPIALDCIISREYTSLDLDAFLSRVQISNNSVKSIKSRKMLGVIIGRNIEGIVENTARKLGFVVVDLVRFFGRQINLVVEKYKSLLFTSGFEESDTLLNIEKTLENIEKAGFDDKLKTFRGLLFEALIRPFFSDIYSKSELFSDKILTHPNKENTAREFDLILKSSHPKEIVLVELKGYQGDALISKGDFNAKSTLAYFFLGSVSLAKAFYKKYLDQGYKLKCLFITSANFHSDCDQMIGNIEGSDMVSDRIGQSCINGDNLLKILRKEGYNHEAKIISTYYVNSKK